MKKVFIVRPVISIKAGFDGIDSIPNLFIVYKLLFKSGLQQMLLINLFKKTIVSIIIKDKLTNKGWRTKKESYQYGIFRYLGGIV